MKYYAVTDDPNELMHFGIKGMKWGVIRTPEQLGHYKTTNARHYGKTRSAAYMRAKAKMSSSMQNGIAAVKAKWDDYNSPANVAARQRQKQINKAVRNYKKNERLFEKHVQLARQGRLKYKGIPDAEVERITNRLELENYARSQSGKEKQSFRRRLNESVANGVITGVGQGTSGYISARMTGRGQTTAKIKAEQRMAAYHNSLRGQIAEERENRALDRKAQAEAMREIDKDYYRAAREAGIPLWEQPTTRSGRAQAYAKLVEKAETEKHERDLQYLRDTEKIKAKYKKNKNKGDKGDEDGNKKIEKNDPLKLTGSDENQVDNPTVTPHSSGPQRRGSTGVNSQIAAAVRGVRQRQKNAQANASTLLNRSRSVLDSIVSEEEAKQSTDYWTRIHDFNEAARKAQERKETAERFNAGEQELARQRKLQEQGFADREARLNYKMNVSDYAREKSNLSGNRRLPQTMAPETRITRTQRFGNVYEMDAPLFRDEEHATTRQSANAHRRGRR